MSYIFEHAKSRLGAGADILDVKVGLPGVDEVEVLPSVALTVSENFDVPICLDSSNREALIAALKVMSGKPLVNSVNGEEASLNAVMPIAKEYRAAVVGLTMDDDGIPNDSERRLSVAGKILERAAKVGFSVEDVVIDTRLITVGRTKTPA